MKKEESHIRVNLMEDHNGQWQICPPKSSSMLLKKVIQGSANEYYVITLLSNGYWKITEAEHNRLENILAGEVIEVKPKKEKTV